MRDVLFLSAKFFIYVKMEPRKPRFSEFEICILLDNIEKHHNIIQSKLTDHVTTQKNNEVWEQIAVKVTASGVCVRSSNDLKKKWDDLKTRSKRKAVDLQKDVNQTGGGKRVRRELTQQETRVVSLLGTTRLRGIDGGVDVGSISAPNEVRNKFPSYFMYIILMKITNHHDHPSQ